MADGPRASALSAPVEAVVLLLSLRYREKLVAALHGAGRPVIAARRADEAARRFEQSHALIALVDLRGAFEAGIEPVAALAPLVEARRGALLAVISRKDAPRVGELYALGATHFLVDPRTDGELVDALRFADRYVRRIRTGGAEAAVAAALTRRSAVARWDWRKGDSFVRISRGLAEMLGEPPSTDRMPIVAAIEALGEEHREAFVRSLLRVAQAGMSGEVDHPLVIDGTPHAIAHNVRVTRSEDGRVRGLSATVEDLDRLLLDRRLSAHFDPLTGLANADFARDWIDQLLGSRSDHDPACIVLMLSLTRFDGINAAYGRALADMLLQAVARRIRRVVGSDLPERMLAARMAGAEFAVAHAGPVKLADVVLLAERLGEAFDRPFLVTGNVIHLATRMGIAVGERDLDGADTLLRRASAALAQAKTGDPHSYEIFMGKGPEELLGRMASLGDDLRASLDEDRFEILYQPQVDIASGRITSVEALTRWRHPRLGLLPPETLLGVAEMAEVTPLLGQHILAKALREAMAWPADLAHLRLSVNLTAEDMALPDFASRVLDEIAASGFDPRRLTVEVTEGGLMRDMAHSAQALASLRDNGLSIAIDDFGTGYSSLAYLRALPIDYLKIDRSFVLDLLGSPRDRVVVRGVVEIARSLGLTVVAEGVETAEQRDTAYIAGCQIYQGFLCSRPIDSRALQTLMREWGASPGATAVAA